MYSTNLPCLTSVWPGDISEFRNSSYFINVQSMHKTKRMQSIEHISMWEVFSTVCP